jgi:CheY-like chemotaxis protein
MIIFYADDDPEDRELFSDALKEVQPDIELVLAEHGNDLLSRLKETPKKPDIIFLDINMPVMDGRECLTALKRSAVFANIPVIIYTTTSSKRELETFLVAGAQGYLIKVPSFQGMKRSIRDIINQYSSR